MELYLATSPVYRKGHTVHRPLPVRWASTWVTRGSSTDLYTSKPCETREEAEKLAHRWLARQNREMADREYVDTSDREAAS